MRLMKRNWNGIKYLYFCIFTILIAILLIMLIPNTSIAATYTIYISPGSYGTYRGSQLSYSGYETGKTLKIPGCDPNPGYEFIGYTIAQGTGSTVSSKNADGTYTVTMGTSDTWVSAVWQGYSYKIHFDANGGTGTMSDQTLTYGTSSTLYPNSFTRIGYRFTGWQYNGTNYSDKQSVSNLTSTKGATLTFKAQWEPYANCYMEYKKETNGYTITGSEYSSGPYAYNSTYVPSSCNFVATAQITWDYNYSIADKVEQVPLRFVFWSSLYNNYYSASDPSFSTSSSYSFSSIIDSDRMNYYQSGSYWYYQVYPVWGWNPVTNLPTRSGYTFGGWFTDSSCTGTRLDTNGTFTPSTTSPETTYYAKWIPVMSDLTVDPNGGTVTVNGTSISSEKTYTQLSGETLSYGKPTKASTTSKLNYTVTYNYNGSGQADTYATSVRTGTTSYTFNSWIKSNPFYGTLSTATGAGTYTFPSNDGVTSKITANYSSSTSYSTTSVVLPNPTRTGYTFGGWYSESGCTNKVGNAGDSYTPTGNTTLYTKWIPNIYTVKYNGNGATGGSTADSSHTYDIAKNLTANGFTRNYTVTYNHNYSGSTNSTKTSTYTFKNWNSVAGGSGTTYTNSQSVTNLASTNGAVVNLYAQWTPASVTYVPTRSGYTFGGWYTSSNLSGSRVDTNGTYTPTASITLYAKWTPNAYIVKYNGNGATGGSTADSSHTFDVAKNLTANGFSRNYTVTYNHNYTGSTNVAKTSTYAFKNWNTVSAGTGTSYSNSQSVTNLSSTNGATVNLYAQWTSASVTYVPTRSGYTFGGWYTSSDVAGSRVDTNGTYTPTASITLYAKWTPNAYTVKYNGNGATGGSMADSSHTFGVAKNLTTNGFTRSYTVTYNHNYTGSTNSTKTSTYTFKNWNSVAGGTGTTYTNSQSVTNLASTNGAIVNLYAQWTPASVTYVPTRSGYTFGGWYTASDLSGSRVDTNGVYTPTANITLYAKWTAIAYTVKYNGNGATGGSTADSSHTYDVAKNLTANGFTRNYTITYNHNYSGSTNSTKTSTYTFKNWNSVAGGTGTTYTNSQSVTNLATTNGATVNLYAQWTPVSVTYVPIRSGYTFGGWFTSSDLSGNRVDTNGVYTPTANITLYAKWTAIAYTVKYNGNGATGGSTADSSHIYDVAKNLTANGFTRNYTVTYNHNYSGSTNTSKTSTYGFKNWNSVAEGTGTTYTNSQSVTNLATTNGATVNLYAQWTPASVTYVPTRSGYTFGGWYITSDLSGSRVDTNGTYTPTGNVTLYAKWTENGYTVKYNGNGATGGNTADSRHAFDRAQNLTANGFTRNYTVTYNHNYSGSNDTSKISTYTFKNWNSVAEGTGTTYTNSQSVTNLATTNGATVNLYAQWTPASVTYVPARIGYIFDGWYTMSDATGSRVDTNGMYTPTENITLYAKWVKDDSQTKKIKYTIEYYKDNILVSADTRVIEKTVWILDSDTLSVDKTQITSDSNKYDGYVIAYTDPATIPDTIDNNGVIKLYYSKRSDLTYKVNYLEKGTNKPLCEQKVVRNIVFDTVINSADEVIPIYGYKYDSVDKDSIKIGTSENIINIYYTKKDTSVLVHHYIDGTTQKLSEDVLIYGKVFDTYTTNEATDIDSKWQMAIVPNNKNGEMTEEQIIVTYYYRKKATRVNVHFYEEGTTNKLSENIVIEGRVDDLYETEAATDIPIKYELASEPENKTGTMTVEEIDVIYYYRVKDAYLNIRYLEKGTGIELRNPEKYSGKVDDDYTVGPQVIEGYTVVEHIGEEEGKLTIEPITITYYYLYNSRAIVQYIDKNTGDILEERIDEGLEGDEFVTESKDFEDYILIEEPNEKIVNMTKEEIVLKYYYVHISAGVIEKHIDKITGEILYNETHEGNDGDEYNILPKSFQNYDLVEEELPENSTGRMTVGPIEVKYYYLYRAEIVVEYIDRASGEKIAGDIVFDGHEGDKQKTEAKKIKDYVLVQAPENDEFTMTKQQIKVVYYYAHISGGVLVNYVDIMTDDKLVPEVTIEGYEGKDYETHEENIDGYDLVQERYPENSKGKMKIELTEVTYYYIKKTNITIKYLDDITKEEIAESEVRPGHEGDEYTTEEKEVEGYDLMKEPENKDGKMGKESTDVIYYYLRPAKVVANYYDIDTKEKLADEEVIVGHDGDEYKTKEKEFEYYNFLGKPENSEGKMRTERKLVDVEKDNSKIPVNTENEGVDFENLNVSENAESDEIQVSAEPADVTKEKIYVIDDTIYVDYYYKKKVFNLNIVKEIKEISYNNNVMNLNGNLGKVEIDKNLVNSANIVVKYRITVINDSELSGNAVIEENIPSGMELRPEENQDWVVKDGKVTLKTKDIEPGKSVSYDVILRWIPGSDNLGMKENIASILETENEAGFDEGDDEDNADGATFILSVGTGSVNNDYTLLNLITVGFLVILAVRLRIIIKKSE